MADYPEFPVKEIDAGDGTNNHHLLASPLSAFTAEAATHHQQKLKEEKSLIAFKSAAANLSSPLYQCVYFIDYEQTESRVRNWIESPDQDSFLRFDMSTLPTGIKNIFKYKNNKSSWKVICMACLGKPDTTLDDSCFVISTETTKKSQTPKSANIQAHYMRNKANKACPDHQRILQKALETTPFKKKLSSPSVTSSGIKGENHNYSTNIKVEAGAQPGPAARHSESTTRPTLEKLQVLIFRLVNDNNLSSTVLQGPQLSELLQFAIRNAHFLNDVPKNALAPGVTKYQTIQGNSWIGTVESIKKVVVRVRKFYHDKIGKETPFIYIGHDLWDGKHRKFVGLCVCFIDPITMEFHIIPIGLLNVKGKDPDLVASQSLAILLRYEIFPSDLLQPITDTTISALLSGRLIGGDSKDGEVESGSTGLHVTELVAKHALGLLKRTKNTRIVDDFQACSQFMNKLMHHLKFVSNKKAKGWFEEYTEVCKNKGGYKVIPFTIPNKIKVAAIHRMLEQAIRSRFALELFSDACQVATTHEAISLKKAYRDLKLNSREWQQAAEMYAILSKAMVLPSNYQVETPGAIALTRLQLSVILLSICTAERDLDVIDLSFNNIKIKVVQFEAHGGWSPEVPYSKLPTRVMSIPPPPMTEPKTPGDWIAGSLVEPLTTMTQMSRSLLYRLLAELKACLKNITNEEDLAMMLNPLVMQHGIPFLKNCNMLTELEIETMKLNLIHAIFALFKKNEEMLPPEPALPHKENVAAAAAHHSSADEDDDGDDDDEENIFLLLEKRRKIAAGKYITNPERISAALAYANATLKVQIENEVRMYFEVFQSYSDEKWQEVVKQFPTDVLKKELEAFEKKSKKRAQYTCWDRVPADVLYTAARFDILSFWRSHSSLFPRVHALACIILGKPYSCAFQERIVHLGSWIDTLLNDTGLEMRVLERANRTFVEAEQKRSPDVRFPKPTDQGIQTIQQFEVSYLEEGKDTDSHVKESLAMTQTKVVELETVDDEDYAEMDEDEYNKEDESPDNLSMVMEALRKFKELKQEAL